MTCSAFAIPEARLKTEENSQFCDEFISDNVNIPKYVFGRNIYAQSVSQHIKIEGFIDEYTNDTVYLGCPVVKLKDVPRDSLVLNVAGGRPLTAQRKLDRAGLRNLDYFALSKLSDLPLVPVRFNEGFEEEFIANRHEYQWVYDKLADDTSKRIFTKLVGFRFTQDLTYLAGFSQREDVQYFEDFLKLRTKGEMFVDVGAYDGFTSLQFIDRCPGFTAVHLFEPDERNFRRCLQATDGLTNVYCHSTGLSNGGGLLKFDMQGSSSRVTEAGAVTIAVERLDCILDDIPTFIKMDIEGGESAAIEGAQETIRNHQPRLAISAYHAAGDFWRIPNQILSIRQDYNIYLRHYTECIYETVLFFIPAES